jgi:hypothetical protein
LAHSTGLAQDAAETGLADAKVGVQWTKESLDRLIGRMAELGILLEKSNPDSARALREAVRFAQTAYISKDMSKVIAYEPQVYDDRQLVLWTDGRVQPMAVPELQGALDAGTAP